MKLVKLSLAVAALLALFIGAFPLKSVDAAAYTPTAYWNNDANYPLAYTQAGVNRYLNLASAKIQSQTKDESGAVTSTVVTFDVIMVSGDTQTKFSYETLIKINGDDLTIAGRKGADNWGLLTDKSFNQPQYNAALILIDHFGLREVSPKTSAASAE